MARWGELATLEAPLLFGDEVIGVDLRRRA